MVARSSAALTSRSCAGQARTATGAATRRAVPAITAAQRRAGVTGPPCGESTSARVRWFSPGVSPGSRAPGGGTTTRPPSRPRSGGRGRRAAPAAASTRRAGSRPCRWCGRCPPARSAGASAHRAGSPASRLNALASTSSPAATASSTIQPNAMSERRWSSYWPPTSLCTPANHCSTYLPLGRGHGLRVEAVDRVGPPLLVQRHRVPGDLDVEDAPRRRPAGLLELRLEVQPADRLDGVPHAEEPHLVQVRVERVREVRVAEALVEQPPRPEELGLLLGRRVLRPVLGVELEGVRREVVGPGPQQADGAQHPGQRPRRVGAAGEAEDEDPVAALVVRRQPGVGLLDVVLHPEPDHQARDPRRLLARARSPPRARPSCRRRGRSRRAGSRTSPRRRTCARRSSSRSPARCSCRPGRPPGSAPRPPPSAHHAPVVEETRQGTHGHRPRPAG